MSSNPEFKGVLSLSPFSFILSPFENRFSTQDYCMILIGGGFTTKPFAHFMSKAFLFSFAFENKFSTLRKKKSPDASHQGFVVAGAGFEPTAFGL